MPVNIGDKGRQDTVVDSGNTALAVGSGSLAVFATPMMVALMEGAAVAATGLPEGQSSVGTALNIQHTAATPVGMRVWAEATVTEVAGRKISYVLEAFDESGKIGEGRHERVVIDVDRFMARTTAKRG